MKNSAEFYFRTAHRNIFPSKYIFRTPRIILKHFEIHKSVKNYKQSKFSHKSSLIQSYTAPLIFSANPTRKTRKTTIDDTLLKIFPHNMCPLTHSALYAQHSKALLINMSPICGARQAVIPLRHLSTHSICYCNQQCLYEHPLCNV